MAVLLEDQVPPAVASLKVVVDPTQTEVVPAMEATMGSALTVIEDVTLELQPAPFVTL
jgi:hypothetical protein